MRHFFLGTRDLRHLSASLRLALGALTVLVVVLRVQSAHACIERTCVGEFFPTPEAPTLVGGVLFAACIFCDEFEPPPLVLIPESGGAVVEGEWGLFDRQEALGAVYNRWHWVPSGTPEPGQYVIQGDGFCAEEGQPDGPTILAATVLPVAPAFDLPRPAYQLGWKRVPAGTLHPCAWNYGSRCGPQRVGTRERNAPYVEFGLPTGATLADRPVLLRVVADTDAGTVGGAWLPPEYAQVEWADGGNGVMTDAADPDADLPGVVLPARAAEYCVAVEMLDLMTRAVTRHAAECIPSPPELPLTDGRPHVGTCSEYLEDATEEDLVRAYCEDNALDCCRDSDPVGCGGFTERCGAGACAGTGEPGAEPSPGSGGPVEPMGSQPKMTAPAAPAGAGQLAEPSSQDTRAAGGQGAGPRSDAGGQPTSAGASPAACAFIRGRAGNARLWMSCLLALGLVAARRRRR